MGCVETLICAAVTGSASICKMLESTQYSFQWNLVMETVIACQCLNFKLSHW